MTSVKKAQFAFLGVGVALILLSVYLYFSAYDLVREGLRAEGVVTGTSVSRDNTRGDNSSGEMISTIRFRTQDGVTVVISAPDAGTRGMPADILYRPEDPSSAKVNSFRGLWFNATLIGAIGAVSFVVGSGIWLATVLQIRRRTRIIAASTPVRAVVTEMMTLDKPRILGGAVMLQGMTAYRLRARGKDPHTGRMREFESVNLWREPHVEADKTVVTVFVYRSDPTRYVVDESSLETLSSNRSHPAMYPGAPGLPS